MDKLAVDNSRQVHGEYRGESWGSFICVVYREGVYLVTNKMNAVLVAKPQDGCKSLSRIASACGG